MTRLERSAVPAGLRRRAGAAPDSAAVLGLARVGLAAYGVVHLLIAWLALQLAWGVEGRDADQDGALGALAATTWGPPLLVVLAVGLGALALWQLGELWWLWRDAGPDGGRRAAVVGTVESVGKAVVYVALGALAVRFATSEAAPADGQQHTAAGFFALPGGRLAVGVVAVVVAGIGVRQWVTGVRADFLEEVDTEGASRVRRGVVRWLGRVGFPAKGTALVLVGVLLALAAWTVDPAQAGGLDGALRVILAAPYGRVLLTVVSLGIGAFGLFSLVRARYPSRT